MSEALRITKARRGKWFGSYGAVICPAHEDRDPSLMLRDGERGRLLVKCYRGCDAREILAALRHDGVLSEEVSSQLATKIERPDEERDRKRRIEIALGIWREANSVAGTPVERYLRGRAITAPIPPTIRYHAALLHAPTGLRLPAMVAAVQSPDRSITGVHRTFLTVDGSSKAPVSNAKLTLGSISTGAVRLAAAADEIAISEGIETGFSFQQATGITTWAALSTSGMRSIVLPPLPLCSVVHVVADADEPGELAAQAIAARLYAEGRKVKIVRPPEGLDFNDLLRAAERTGAI